MNMHNDTNKINLTTIFQATFKHVYINFPIPAWEILVAVQQAGSTIKCVTSIVNSRALATSYTIDHNW